MTLQDFSAYYAELPDGELAKIASSRSILVPEAKRCLDAEIAKRGWTPEDIKRFKNYRHSYHDPETPIQRKIRRSKLLGKVNEARKMPTLRWRGILISIGCSIVAASLFGYFGLIDVYMPICCTLMVLFFTPRFHWELKDRWWFWVTIGLWTALHAWMIARIHWPRQWVPGRSWAGVATIDLVMLFVVIALIEKMLHEGPWTPKPRHLSSNT